MKRSIKRLPKRTQEELAVLQELILKYIPEVRMIILFGSYARGNYVLYEESVDGNARASYQSDLDILVVTGVNNSSKLEGVAFRVIGAKYEERMANRRHVAPPQIIVENIGLMNRVLREKHYFYAEIMKEGIMMYDDGKFVMPKAEKLSRRRIKEIAQEHYDVCYPFGRDFLQAGYFFRSQEKYVMGSFQLHQACERFYKTLLLVFISKRPKSHKLEYLGDRTRGYDREMAAVFPINAPEDKLSYEKLCDAYIDARYNPNFTVNSEQFDYMIRRTEVLQELVGRLCLERLACYEKDAKEEEDKHGNSEVE